MVPDGVKVVSALHTVSAASLTDLDYDLAQDVLVCGDSREDKRRAALLIERIEGLRCIDCGRLEMARIAESITALDDLHQRQAQNPRGHQDHRPARRRLGVSSRRPRWWCSPEALVERSSRAGCSTSSALRSSW